MAASYYLTLDIGGTKISAALFTRYGEIAGDIVLTAKTETFRGEEAVYRNVRNLLNELLMRHQLETGEILGIGVGSPGPLDTKRGIILHAPLMKWRNFPVLDRLTADFNLPARLDNDGNLGALAEQRRGAAIDLRNILYMTVSTGCGGGILINGEIYRGANDGAGEVGHMSIDPEGLECPCGSRGCFELYASGTALLNTMKADMAAGKKSRVFTLAGNDGEKLSGYHLDEAAALGDTYALALYRKEGYYLGVGLANLFNLFDPQAIVLGGGITKGRRFFHQTMMDTLKERCEQPINDDSVRYSEMNDRVVLYGAFFLIREYVEKRI
ncbi:MAG: ROK family protein [Spirochaetaceae bacterium]|jgi:glucokinase|nr:ROK family protein [Spirochaetaceae bacterium]